jgi:hypothetical protein
MKGGTIGGTDSVGGTDSEEDDGNTATRGGGISVNSSTFNITGANCKIIGNTATTNGGGAYISNGTFNIAGADCEITGNTAEGNGGGISGNYTNSANISISVQGSVIFSGNMAGNLYKLLDDHKTWSPKGSLFAGTIKEISVPALNVVNFGPLVDGNYGGPPPKGYNETNANKRSVFNNYDISYIGTMLSSTVVLSNTVTGYPPDTDKEYTFTLSFRDGPGNEDNDLSYLGEPYTKITYKGGIIDGSGADKPANGVLTLNSDGTTTPETVTLKHGQLISITMPSGAEIKIRQEPENLYRTSFQDSEAANPESKSDTGWQPVTQKIRTFDFTNKSTVPPAGISTGSVGIALPFVMMICGFILLQRSIANLRRRRPAWDR